MSKAQRCYFLIDYLRQYFPGPCLFSRSGVVSLWVCQMYLISGFHG